MQDVLTDTDKIIIDGKSGGVVPYLPLVRASEAAAYDGAFRPRAEGSNNEAHSPHPVLLLAGILAVAAYLTLFTVYQTQQALVLEFGKPKRLVTDPGLNYKIPFIQNVVFFDKRLLDLDSAPQEVIASDQKRLVVDAFARWRITDPLLFYQTVNNRAGAARSSALSSRRRSGACSAPRASRPSCATSATRSCSRSPTR